MKKTIYLIEAHDQIDDEIETMTIGFFDSIDECNGIIKKYRLLPGFCFVSCTLDIKEFFFELDSTEKVINCVYYVQTAVTYDPVEEDVVVEQGVYLNQQEANDMANLFQKKTEERIDQIVEQLSHNKGFIPEINTYVDKYIINECHWTEGFERVPWYVDEK